MNNITLLFVITGLIAVHSYNKTQLKLLSPTFWASAMFCLFSGIYVLTFSTMRNDISVETLLIILAGIFSVATGCFIGNHVRFKSRIKNDSVSDIIVPFQYGSNCEIHIDEWKTIVVSSVYLLIAVIRIKNFISYMGGGFSSILTALSGMRASYDDVVNGTAVLSSGYLNQIGYICEIATYIYLFAFVYNLVVCKKRRWLLLLPLIPDFLARLVTTSRSSFLVLLFALATSYFFILVKQGRHKAVLFSPKMILIVAISFVAFFWYGQMRNELDISLLDNIQMYTSASIYNFDYYIRHGWPENPYFGYYTLQKIYDVFNISHTSAPDISMPMVYFSTHGMRSNIYTSFFQTIQDYGIPLMLLFRFVETFIGTKIIRSMLSRDIDENRFYFDIYFVIIVLYSFANFPIGNRFGDYILNGTVLIRFAIYGWVFIKYFLKPKVVKY